MYMLHINEPINANMLCYRYEQKINNLEELISSKLTMKMVGRTLFTLRQIKGDKIWERIKEKTELKPTLPNLFDDYVENPKHAAVFTSTEFMYIRNRAHVDVMEEKVSD